MRHQIGNDLTDAAVCHFVHHDVKYFGYAYAISLMNPAFEGAGLWMTFRDADDCLDRLTVDVQRLSATTWAAHSASNICRP
jgi:hypothetical protein